MLLPGEVVELVLIAGEEPPVRLKMKETETKLGTLRSNNADVTEADRK